VLLVSYKILYLAKTLLDFTLLDHTNNIDICYKNSSELNISKMVLLKITHTTCIPVRIYT